MLTPTPEWSLPVGNTVVPSRWQATVEWRMGRLHVPLTCQASTDHRPNQQSDGPARDQARLSSGDVQEGRQTFPCTNLQVRFS